MRWLALLSAVLLFHSTANAHALEIEHTISPTQIVVTVKFDTGETAEEVEVILQRVDGSVMRKYKTDKSGIVTIERPKDGSYVLVADAGAGHLVKKPITVNDDVEVQSKATQSRLQRFLLGLGVLLVLMVVGWAFSKKKK